MTTDPTIAALCERLRHCASADDVDQAAATIEALAARLATVEAERDAAVAMVQRSVEQTSKAIENTSTSIGQTATAMQTGIAEGERRERARIVAWLRDAGNSASSARAEDALLWACGIVERGDHLQGLVG
jgi:hypothetical protein